MNISEHGPKMQGGERCDAMTDLLAAALAYAEKGWPVFPCHPQTKAPYLLCDRDTKGEPIKGTGGFHKASKDPETIRGWWGRWPNAMIAVPTGKAIGAWVLDIDDEAAFATVERELGLPATLTALSAANRGRHMYFAYTDDEAVPNTLKIFPGADTRGDGGYIIVPPSVRSDGSRYEWVREEDPSEPPDAVVAAVRAKGGNRTTAASDPRYAVCAGAYTALAVDKLGLPVWVNSEAARLAQVVTPKGKRSEAVKRFVAQAIREGWTDAEIGGVLLHPANSIAEKPRERPDRVAYIGKEISHYRSDEGAAEGELPHIRDYPRIDWAAFIANGARKQAERAPAPLNVERPVDADRMPLAYHDFDPDYVAPPAAWLAKGLLPRSGIGLLFGESGAGKSFAAVHAAQCVAWGLPLFGAKIKQGGVLYIATEGSGSIDNRMAAANRALGGAIMAANLTSENGERLRRAPIRIVTEAPNLSRDGSATPLVETIEQARKDFRRSGHRLALVIIDTWHAALGGGEENSAADAGFALKPLIATSADGDFLTLIIHHPGKDSERGARGSNALPAAADAILAITVPGHEGAKAKPSDAARKVTVTKMRDGDAGAQYQYRLNVVQTGTDEDGDAITTCTVEAFSSPDSDPFEGVSSGDLFMVQQAIAAGSWRAHHTATEWAGKAVADVLGFDLSIAAHERRVKSMLGTWLTNGALKQVDRRHSERRETKAFIEVGSWAEAGAQPRRAGRGEAGQ